MRRDNQQRSSGVVEKWRNEISDTPTLQYSTIPRNRGFALYEVLLGVLIFVVGVLALGRAAQNCLNASMLTAEEDRIRQVLSNRMAEIQATPGIPDASKELKIDTGYGMVNVVQKTTPAGLKEPEGAELNGVNVVTLTAKWARGGTAQSESIEFYVYRMGQ